MFIQDYDNEIKSRIGIIELFMKLQTGYYAD